MEDYWGSIKIYSHYFLVTVRDIRLGEAVRAFSLPLVQKELKKRGRRFIPTASRVFARRSLRSNSFGFHINSIEAFFELLKEFDIPDYRVNVERVPMYKPKKFHFDSDFALWEDQIPITSHLVELDNQRAATVQPGGGKGQVLSAKVKVPGGWCKMGDIKVGDLVTAHDGYPTRVTGVFPQGIKDVYRVTFADGRYTDVDDTHLWSIKLRHNARERVIDTLAMKALVESDGDNATRVTVPLPVSEHTLDMEYPIHPYVLGVLLGDGYIRENRVSVTKPDAFIQEKVESLLPLEIVTSSINVGEGRCATFGLIRNKRLKSHRYDTDNILIDQLAELGLTSLRSWEKFVPEEYLNGSHDQRLELLRGLLDTDGTIDSKKTVSFSSTSLELSKSVQYLVRSLGGMAKITPRTPHYVHKGERKEGRTDYRVNIRHPDPGSLFSLPRKREMGVGGTQYSAHMRLRVISVEQRPREPTQCIMVDHPDHLYITDDFIVTHNTIMSLDAVRQLGYRFAVVTQGGYEERWLPAIREQLKLDVDEIRSCCGAIAICDLIKEKMKKGIDDVKAIFISIAGIRAYIKNYEAGKYNGTMWEAVPPENLYEFLEVGVRITDEAHKDLHANYISDLYTHIPYTIYLTATLIPRDEFMAMIYELYIPKVKRKEMDNLNVYVRCVEVEYYLQDPHSVQWKSQDGMYSHTVFEQWIMKNDDRLGRYIKGIYDYALIPWLGTRVHDTKMIFFVATIEMGRILTEYLQRRCPDLLIQQYKAGDPYDILVDSDVIVSTILKAGTAVDIPDLERAHCTVAIDSPNAVIQVLGRLRQLKQLPDVQCLFYYYTCLHIPRHIDYSKKKRILLRDRVLGFDVEPLGIRV